ncbi:MAG: peptide ABC transporter ATP-binding protein [Ferrovibrio sp.]|nr:MAG: peptide ABC transporter ATP-binding protein [Ferrovibrio sp.]
MPVLHDLSFTVQRGETLCLVGESGCGKSITALALLRLLPKGIGRISAGRLLFDGTDLATLDEPAMRQIRGNRIAMIFQEPMTSLNPVLTIGRQIGEVLRLHQGLTRHEADQKTVRLLERVRIPDATRRLGQYPHQLSGGMRQRVMIAMALACSPQLLIADEPTTALDVTIQAQILALLDEIRAETGAAVIMITHDLGVVAEVADRVVVLYAGRAVEQASVSALFAHPHHPYTRGLMESVPHMALHRGGRGVSRLQEIKGTVPSPFDMPPGCAFAPRCALANDVCATVPALQDFGAGHAAACWHAAQPMPRKAGAL